MIRVLLCGAGGYGANYVNALLSGERPDVVLTGVVDPTENDSVNRVKAAGVRVYAAIEDFTRENAADLAIIASPIQFHESQAIACMAAGMDVLCEKPIAATPEAALRMAESRNGRKLTVGYQLCFDPAMTKLRQDCLNGRLGRPIALKSITLWPRNFAYYARGGGWAGKKYSKDGSPIFDSVASNATAHYLMNMLFLTGEKLALEKARIWRANAIETFDTVWMEGASGQTRVVFCASHAVEKSRGPILDYQFEHGRVRWEKGNLIAHMNDGTEIDYGLLDLDSLGRMYKLWSACDRVNAPDDSANPCPPETALLHAQAMADLRDVCPEAEAFPAEKIHHDPDRVWVEGLFEELMEKWEEA